MEVSYDRKQEEMEVDKTKNKNEIMSPTKKPISPTSSDTDGSCVSNDTNFDYLSTKNNETNLVVVTTNVEYQDLLLSQKQVEVHVQETNGFFSHQNGSIVAVQRHGEESEMNFGLNEMDSLLDRRTENEISTENENASVEEYDVERVIQKQQTHDLICPNCHSCITRRVILKRKRKTPETSSSNVPDSVLGPPQQRLRGDEVPSRLDGLSCFSCFSLFIPSGDGFLNWRFKLKVDSASTDDGQAEDSKADDPGSIFPLWVVTCCQPAEKIKPDASPHQTQPPIPELPPSDDIPVPTIETRPPSDDTPVLPPYKAEHPAFYVPGTTSPFKPVTSLTPIDAVSPVTYEPLPSDSQGAETLPDVEGGLGNVPRRPGVSGVDVIKAIVYGGLLESITSLSVISSAAGGDATTLNIVALGLANVFGGLVVLVHNLRVLKQEHTTEHYESQLGRPGHYMVHAVIATISYLIFGLMSPLIYGFTFRKSDNKDYKLATLAAAALTSITLLSAAKAYVRNPPKGYIKTVLYYINLGFMVSGLGYVAGDVINMLMKKLGVFDPSASTGVMNGAWSSY